MTTTNRLAIAVFALFALVGPARAEQAASTSKSTVGMPAKIDQLVIPGTRLEVKPVEDRREPVVLRIVEAYPHGTAFRYDLVYYALEPGDYDLAKYMRRADGSPLGEIPPIPVKVEPLLPPGQMTPHGVALATSPRLGGYRFLVAVLASLWFAGLAYILMKMRGGPSAVDAASARPVTLGERLRPLVSAAIDGSLGEAQRAELERLLIGYWRKRLGLDHERPAVAMAAMRDHPEAGPLLRRLEDWLHRPESDRVARAGELDELLRPYLDLPADPAPEPGQSAVAGGRTA